MYLLSKRDSLHNGYLSSMRMLNRAPDIEGLALQKQYYAHAMKCVDWMLSQVHLTFKVRIPD